MRETRGFTPSVAILLASLLCLLAAVSAEYHVEKFLKDRDAYLHTFIDVPPTSKIDQAIEKFALEPGTTTVRLAPWPDCKHQFVLHHERVVKNDHPIRFQSYCPASAADMAAYQQRLNRRKKGGKADEPQAAAERPVPPPGHPVPKLDAGKAPPAKDIRIAFSLFVNPNDPIWRIHRVINAIYSKQDFYFVHIDASPQYRNEKEREDDKAPRNEKVQAIHDVMAEFVKNGNMKVEAVFDVSWGGISMMNAEIAMAEGLLKMGKWDYWINLSSTDYPLKPIDDFRKKLAEDYGKNFGHGFKSDMSDEDKNAGMMRTYVECAGHSYRVDDLMPLPKGLDIWGASSWYVLHRNFVEWLDGCMALGFSERKKGQCSVVLDFLDYSQYRVNFEEQFLQTVQKNTEWCDHYKNDDMRYVDWTKDWDGCEHWEEVDGCGSSPQTINFKKWKQGSMMPNKFFARKFEDPVVFDKMDKALGLNTTVSMSKFVADAEYNARHKKSDEPNLPNVAAGKGAWASTEQWNDGKTYWATNACDDNKKTRWSSDHYEPQHIGIKLATDTAPFCDVQEVHIQWETAYAATYDLLVSDNMKDWTVAFSGTEENHPRPRNKGELTHRIPLGDMGKAIQGIKFECKTRGTSWGFSVWEIRAFGECASVGGGDAAAAARDAPAL